MQTFLIGRGDSQTKIYQAHCFVICDHDIVRLDVPMHNILSVGMVNRLEKTPHILGSLPLRENLVFLLTDLVEERHTVDILHDQIDVHGVIISLVILHDVWVVKSVQDCDLVHNIA